MMLLYPFHMEYDPFSFRSNPSAGQYKNMHEGAINIYYQDSESWIIWILVEMDWMVKSVYLDWTG